MTQTHMLHEIRALGADISVRVLDSEIRLNYKGADEATAYYTNDRADALATARLMARKVAATK